MAIPELSSSEWLSIITHVKKWVSNLRRARADRKRESKEALRAVVIAVRETTVYLRSLREGTPPSLEKEEKLSLRWTELAFKLEDLSLQQLANKCRIKGQYWADPKEFDPGFLDTAANRLKEIEHLAQASLQDLKG